MALKGYRMNQKYIPNPVSVENGICTMPALTIHAPYAQLILLPESDERHKRIENRTWPTGYRGRFAIHCSMNRKPHRDFDWGIPDSDVHHGHIIGFANVYSCEPNPAEVRKRLRERFKGQEKHLVGPYYWVLRDVATLDKPVPAKGFQRWWYWSYELKDEPAFR